MRLVSLIITQGKNQSIHLRLGHKDITKMHHAHPTLGQLTFSQVIYFESVKGQ